MKTSLAPKWNKGRRPVTADGNIFTNPSNIHQNPNWPNIHHRTMIGPSYTQYGANIPASARQKVLLFLPESEEEVNQCILCNGVHNYYGKSKRSALKNHWKSKHSEHALWVFQLFIYKWHASSTPTGRARPQPHGWGNHALMTQWRHQSLLMIELKTPNH